MATDEQEKLGRDYADYLAERDKLAAEGRAIGTFSAWAHDRKLIVVAAPKRGRSRD